MLKSRKLNKISKKLLLDSTLKTNRKTKLQLREKSRNLNLSFSMRIEWNLDGLIRRFKSSTKRNLECKMRFKGSMIKLLESSKRLRRSWSNTKDSTSRPLSWDRMHTWTSTGFSKMTLHASLSKNWLLHKPISQWRDNKILFTCGTSWIKRKASISSMILLTWRELERESFSRVSRKLDTQLRWRKAKNLPVPRNQTRGGECQQQC